MLLVLYQLFTLAGYQKIREIVEDEVTSNAQKVLIDLQYTVPRSTTIDEPLIGLASSTLRLSGGTVVYQVDANNTLQKTEGGVTAPLTNEEVAVDSISFTHLGPSGQSPTISVVLTLSGRHLVEGRVRSKTVQTSVTIR